MKPTAVQCRCVLLFLACTLSGSLNKSWVDDRNQASVSPNNRLQIFASVLSVAAVGALLLTLLSVVLA